MYGCNKLYCEHLGRYYARHYKQLAPEPTAGRVDFRCVRFPGLISAMTTPSGGTSDYASEMIHAAARGVPYACFVRPDTRIPFMAMPDAIDALLLLAAAPRDRLTRTAYNLTAFSPTASDICDTVEKVFPKASVSFDVDVKRQRIVDSWPADVDDSAARRDWGFSPRYDFTRAFDEYLIPTIRERYQ
jgi:nucleoside-diphosphate-sugar epimerase